MRRLMVIVGVVMLVGCQTTSVQRPSDETPVEFQNFLTKSCMGDMDISDSLVQREMICNCLVGELSKTYSSSDWLRAVPGYVEIDKGDKAAKAVYIDEKFGVTKIAVQCAKSSA